MPDDAQPAADTSLDELERRVAAFQNATRRLQRNMDEPAPALPQPAAAAPAGAGSSATRKAFAGGEEISGLRPAVPTPGPATGALTARRRSSEGGGATPGFTSAFGKPSIPLLPAEPAAAVTAATTRRGTRPQAWWNRRPVRVVAVIATLLVFVVSLRLSFRELPDAAVWAETVRCTASAAGRVGMVAVQVGETVAAGAVLARVGDTPVLAPEDGTVVRLLIIPGARLAAGEQVAELAKPATVRVVVALPPSGGPLAGDRVSVSLLGEGRVTGGMIERVLAPGDPGAWSDGGPAPRRATILLDPAPTPPRLGQGARVTPLGHDPGPLRLALFAIRRMLPW